MGDLTCRAWGLYDLRLHDALDGTRKSITNVKPSRARSRFAPQGRIIGSITRAGQEFRQGGAGKRWSVGAGHSKADDRRPALRPWGCGFWWLEERCRASGRRCGAIRYHSLQLHNEIYTIDFPYVTYPQTWPSYLPKDMYSPWMEFYALAMELAVWTRGALIESGSFRRARPALWQARLRGCLTLGAYLAPSM